MSTKRTNDRIDRCAAIGMKMSFAPGSLSYVTDAVPAGHFDITDIQFMSDEEFEPVFEIFRAAIDKQKQQQP